MSDNPTEAKLVPIGDRGRPFEELRDTGLVWLFNTTVLHPRGYALAIHLADDGEATGWSLLGDGSEPWAFACDDATRDMLDERFQAIKDLLP
jgi:hypothetical protein